MKKIILFIIFVSNFSFYISAAKAWTIIEPSPETEETNILQTDSRNFVIKSNPALANIYVPPPAPAYYNTSQSVNTSFILKPRYFGLAQPVYSSAYYLYPSNYNWTYHPYFIY